MRRPLSALVRAPLQRWFWRLHLEIYRHFEHPWSCEWEYAVGRGSYPRTCIVNTPSGRISPTLYSADDLVTLVECFAKLDYRVQGNEHLIVDFGSNIGLSALYFLTHAPSSDVYLFEPEPRNISRLTSNLADFADRITVVPAAVADHDARAMFGVEPTGRYGALELEDALETVEVDVQDADRVLREIFARHGPIDVLKIDIEGYEKRVLSHLSAETLKQIKIIYAETFDDFVTLDGFEHSKQGAVSRYCRVHQAL